MEQTGIQVKKPKNAVDSINKVLKIFVNSNAEIRPHFIITGPSGSGKSFTITQLAEELDINIFEINAAGLTKEGTAGNSLSKALAPLMQLGSSPAICFVDEFDKLFISGNSNSSLAHEITNGVQNEFLKVIEGQASIYGEYGKYVNISTSNVLFVFAGAFNGETDITLDRLREFGLKTEFLGRVGLAYALDKFSIEELENILDTSPLLGDYLRLFSDVKKEDVLEAIMGVVIKNFEKNTIGIRMLTSLIHQYFIEGGLEDKVVKKTTFQKTLQISE